MVVSVKGIYILYNVYAWTNSVPSVLHFSAFIISYIELEFSESCNLHAHKQTESDISGMHEPKLLRSIARVF